MASVAGRYSSISIHTLRMEGDQAPGAPMDPAGISIHTLRMEGDRKLDFLISELGEFQSTPSAWRVTRKRTNGKEHPSYFNPHPPHGG